MPRQSRFRFCKYYFRSIDTVMYYKREMPVWPMPSGLSELVSELFDRGTPILQWKIAEACNLNKNNAGAINKLEARLNKDSCSLSTPPILSILEDIQRVTDIHDDLRLLHSKRHQLFVYRPKPEMMKLQENIRKGNLAFGQSRSAGHKQDVDDREEHQRRTRELQRIRLSIAGRHSETDFAKLFPEAMAKAKNLEARSRRLSADTLTVKSISSALREGITLSTQLDRDLEVTVRLNRARSAINRVLASCIRKLAGDHQFSAYSAKTHVVHPIVKIFLPSEDPAKMMENAYQTYRNAYLR